MKKQILKNVIAATLSLGLASTGAFAAMFDGTATGGDALQDVLDGITVGSDSSVNVYTDEVDDLYDSYWQIAAGGSSAATIIIELAGYDDGNTFGIYDSADKTNFVELFAGLDGAEDRIVVDIYADGSVWLNGSTLDTGIDFAGNSFGFYLDAEPSTPNTIYYSDTSLNTDGYDHMYAYEGGNGDTVSIPPLSAGEWVTDEYVLAWEDLYGGGDKDHTDMVLMVTQITPIPEPTTMLLFGTGLAGLAGVARRRRK
ncbi:DUF4114 domain-containing protein [Desulfogranum marinum]|uniref:DUF4114 domain-containing protein n=1 Tax=Desulfogranum marinum TaxID=453220 RepID=UPI0019625488|nr:DUF4114 domain-containing protein [Desulfogranum marinum]MBM9512739.1 DUF4114 domain-containing protein [Desulfogranum marinum]